MGKEHNSEARSAVFQSDQFKPVEKLYGLWHLVPCRSLLSDQSSSTETHNKASVHLIGFLTFCWHIWILTWKALHVFWKDTELLQCRLIKAATLRWNPGRQDRDGRSWLTRYMRLWFQPVIYSPAQFSWKTWFTST